MPFMTKSIFTHIQRESTHNPCEWDKFHSDFFPKAVIKAVDGIWFPPVTHSH